MEILFLLTQDLDSPSGGGRYLPLAVELSRLGHGVSLAALHSSYNTIAQRNYELGGVKIEYVSQMHVKKSGNIKAYFSFFGLIKVVLQATFQLTKAALNTDAKVIHIGKPHPMNGIAALIANALKGKTIYLDCDDNETRSTRFGGVWQRWVISFWEMFLPKRVKLVTSNTYTTIERLKKMGIPQDKLVYLPNGVDSKRFSVFNQKRVAELQCALNLGDSPVVAYVGSLSLTSHPVDILLKAFRIVYSRIPNALLLIVGGGEDYLSLKNQARDLGIFDSVRFIGKVSPEEVVNYYHLADLTVDPVADDEASRGRAPLKMFESWAAGVPFISSAVGDRPTLAGDPPAAYLTQAGDPNDLAKAISLLLNDRTLSNGLRERGLDRIKEFDWERIAEQIQWIYQT